MIAYDTLKPYLFKLDAERAHNVSTCLLQLFNYVPALANPMINANFIEHQSLHQKLFNHTFYNPIGLAAGFDKEARLVRATQAMGFGFSEVGTITLKAQKGNAKPRLWRHIEEESLQNAMGFNNKGAYVALQQLKKIFPFSTPIGVNIGKNKNTPEHLAVQEYKTLIKSLHEHADYMVINISSPNTPGLRDLQNETFIQTLFTEAKSITSTPILLKLAPDMPIDTAIALSEHAINAGASGIIATNTTVDYTLVSNPYEMGGLSGVCLKEKSFEFFNALADALYAKTTLISVGGINDASEVYRRLRAGASLVQLYSALVFQGPSLIQSINRELIERLHADGFSSITEVIGADR